jgi:hypothetical protein
MSHTAVQSRVQFKYVHTCYKKNMRTGVIQRVNEDIDTHTAMVMGYNKHVYSYIHYINYMYMHSDLSVNNHKVTFGLKLKITATNTQHIVL